MGATVITQFSSSGGWDLPGWTLANDVDGNGETLTFNIANGVFQIPDGDLRVFRTPGGTVNTNVGTMTRTFDTTGFSDVTLTLNIYQPNGSTWEDDNELFQILINTGSGFTSVYENFRILTNPGAVSGTADGTMVTVTLDSNIVNMDNVSNLGVQLWFRPGFYPAGGRNSTSVGGEEYVLRDFTITGIPEPSTALLGAFGLLALLRRRR